LYNLFIRPYSETAREDTPLRKKGGKQEREKEKKEKEKENRSASSSALPYSPPTTPDAILKIAATSTPTTSLLS
jgi:hypothetical protein